MDDPHDEHAIWARNGYEADKYTREQKQRRHALAVWTALVIGLLSMVGVAWFGLS